MNNVEPVGSYFLFFVSYKRMYVMINSNINPASIPTVMEVIKLEHVNVCLFKV